jgi:hypothetical protein
MSCCYFLPGLWVRVWEWFSSGSIVTGTQAKRWEKNNMRACILCVFVCHV